jgi:hypothetical protein
MSRVFIEERAAGAANQVAAAGPVVSVQSSGPCNVKAPLAQVVGEARHAVQIATKEATAADAGNQQVIQPVHSGTYRDIQAVQTASGGTEYVAFRD